MHDQDSQKNLLIAIVLSVAVLLAWQMFYAGPRLKEQQERREHIQQEQTQAKAPPGADKAVQGTLPPAAVQAPALSREAAIAEGGRIAIATPSLSGSLSLK